MIELLASLTVLNVGILAIVAAFNSGAVTLRRASQISTASALADQQMERFRAITYGAISLDTTSIDLADSTYTSDTVAYTAYTDADRVKAACSPIVNECTPVRTIDAAASPDHRSYRVDTYIVYDTPTGGRELKKVTVVVRDNTSLKALARVASTFDESTGG